MRRTLLPLAALAALVLFSGVAAAESGDPAGLVDFINGLIDSLNGLLEMLPDAE